MRTITEHGINVAPTNRRRNSHCLLAGLILAVTIFGVGNLYSCRWNNPTIPMQMSLHRSTINKSVAAENGSRFNHKLLIWIAAYDPLDRRDQYVLHHLVIAKNICESSTYETFVRIFVATCSQDWHGTNALRDFINRNRPNITRVTNSHVSSDDNIIIIEHFTCSCVEFMIGYYKVDLKLALPYQHRAYFRQHVNEFDWFWFTEDDLLYDSHTYWMLVKDTSFALDTLSSTQTDDLLTLYARNGKKPKISTFGRYFFLPTLMRFEKPEKEPAVQSIGDLDIWRLTDMGLCCQPLLEALIYFNEQWWLQPSNSHSAYYLLPRRHMHVIVNQTKWLDRSEESNREWISSFWLSDFGYIRVASITHFTQYLVHHASNKYYHHHFNLPKASLITRTLGFVHEQDRFSPTLSTRQRLLNYSTDHTNDTASCFPLSFYPIPKQLHEAIPLCLKLMNSHKTNS